jgi:hypothetical protein
LEYKYIILQKIMQELLIRTFKRAHFSASEGGKLAGSDLRGKAFLPCFSRAAERFAPEAEKTDRGNGENRQLKNINIRIKT